MPGAAANVRFWAPIAAAGLSLQRLSEHQAFSISGLQVGSEFLAYAAGLRDAESGTLSVSLT
jgi:hypothetical protein